MPVPQELKLNFKKSLVFCYSKDLEEPAATLAEDIDCDWVSVTLGKGKILSSDPIPTEKKAVAWLVGHGLRSDNYIGSSTRGNYVEIRILLDWLNQEGYSAVVDTCCEPNLRRVVAEAYRLDYYSCPDDFYVHPITGFDNIDLWWDTNKMAFRSCGGVGGQVPKITVELYV